jgi:hypothetical protein
MFFHEKQTRLNEILRENSVSVKISIKTQNFDFVRFFFIIILLLFFLLYFLSVSNRRYTYNLSWYIEENIVISLDISRESYEHKKKHRIVEEKCVDLVNIFRMDGKKWSLMRKSPVLEINVVVCFYSCCFLFSFTVYPHVLLEIQQKPKVFLHCPFISDTEKRVGKREIQCILMRDFNIY